MKACMFLLFMMKITCIETVLSAEIDQRWDEDSWSTSIGSAANTNTVITPKPNGEHYLYVDLYRNGNNSGMSGIYTPLGSNSVSSGTPAGSMMRYWLEFDYRYKGGSSNANVFVGLFNEDGDNDGSPAMNWCGVQLSASNVVGIKFSSAGQATTSSLAGSGSNVLHRVKAVVYNSGGQTLMDIRLYRVDGETFELWKIGEIRGHVLLATGESFPEGMDVLGVRNTYYSSGTPAAHAQYDIDNIYFSTVGAQPEVVTPSFAPLSVRAVFENDGLTYFDPWNTNRWAAWYSNVGGTNVLVHQFSLDCDVTMSGLSEPWEPDVSSLPVDHLFYLGNAFKGKAFNGGGNSIDIRKPNAQAVSISQLYADPTGIPEGDRCPLQHCFYVVASESATEPATVVEDLWIYGFATSIYTELSCKHPLFVKWVNIRRAISGFYLMGQNTTIQNCSLKQNARLGMYLDLYSSFNTVTNVTFEDNNYYQYIFCGDVAVDSTYGNVFEGNTHVSSTDPQHRFNAAYKLYRNMGEDDVLRENPPAGNVFRDNTISNYDVGFDVGARMGMSSIWDMTEEGRDYAPYNIFQSNTVTDTSVAIKINSSGNIIDGNYFMGVTHRILLHCVWNSLTETFIRNQNGTRISYWFDNADWTTNSSWSAWFAAQKARNSGVSESEKYIHIGYSGTPSFDSYSGPATLVKKGGGNPSQIIDLSTMKDVCTSGGTPIDVAVGDFWEYSPGDEIAVIWDTPVSNVDGTNYYTIIIYDSDGIEVNRCGRSLTKWSAITAGDFLNLSGDEIAAVHETSVNGKCPIYVFSRGRENANVTLLTGNTVKITALASGNFNTSGDSYDEVAFVRQDTQNTIRCVKPTDTGWWINILGTIDVFDMAAGDIDGIASNGDEVAVISATASRAYLYRPGATTHYNTVGPSSGSALLAIGAGDFDGDADDEVALALATAANGEYPIQCYNQGSSNCFKEISQNVLGVTAKAIAVCDVSVGEALGVYERVQGFTSTNYSSAVSTWGDCVAVLPSAPQTNAIPLFLLNADPDDGSREYLKVVPVVK